MAEVGPAITVAFQFFAKRATTMLIVPEWFPTVENIQYNLAVEKLDKVVYRLIRERRELLRKDEINKKQNLGINGVLLETENRQDLLTRLLKARDEDGSKMDDVALRDELMTLLVAGQETSAILLAWTCALLAQNPTVQDELAEEVQRVLEGEGEGGGGGERELTYKDVPKLRKIEAVLLESMRVRPPAYIVGRCACQEASLGPYTLPRGTTVLVSPYLLHRDPAYWGDSALTFDPSRWLPGSDKKEIFPKDNKSYWAFGGGPRNCIGMGFAMMEASLVLATILRKCVLEMPAGESPPQPKAMITLRPEGKVNLVIRPRRKVNSKVNNE